MRISICDTKKFALILIEGSKATPVNELLAFENHFSHKILEDSL